MDVSHNNGTMQDTLDWAQVYISMFDSEDYMIGFVWCSFFS